MKKINVDRVVGLSAMLISLITLIMFIYQTNIMYKQSRLSIRPRLSFTTKYHYSAGKLEYSTILKNKGIGPAIIEKTEIELDGKKYPMDLEYFFNKTYPKMKEWGNFTNFSNLAVGATLSADESRILFAYEFDEKYTEEISRYLKVEDQEKLPFNIIIEYTSMYEEKWKIDVQENGRPVSMD